MGTQTRYPTSAVNDATVGTRPWLDTPGQFSLQKQVEADDGKHATTSSSLLDNEVTKLLKVGYTFEVPSEATDVSVTFRVQHYEVGSAKIRDAAARLVLGGTVQPEDHSLPGDWPSTAGWAEYAFGGLTPAQVNDSAFGFALAAKKIGTSPDPDFPLTATPFVDVIEAVATW